MIFVGCTADRPAPDPTLTLASVTPAERDTALAWLDRFDDSAFRTAFGTLNGYAYTRYVRTEQFNKQDAIIAYEQSELRYDAGSTTPDVLDDERAGEFDYGMFHSFESQAVEDLYNPDLTDYVLPTDPAYLSPRYQENFQFRMRSDTLMYDRQARVIEVRAIPRLGDGQNIRKVRYYLDRRTDNLIALYLERIDLTMLYREESTFFVHIRPAEDGTWVPFNTRFESRVRTPFNQPQKFRTVSTFYDYATTTDS